MPYLYQSAEKYIKDIYWSESHDKTCTLDISKVVADKLVKDNKEKDPEYYNHRAGIVHVSSLSNCLRGVILEMVGAPKDEKDPQKEARQLGVFRAGNIFEDYIVGALGDKMLDRQTEYIFKYKNLILTGRDDGTIMHDGERRVLEAKSVHSQSFWNRQQEGTLIATHNQMQLQTYLWLRRECQNMFEVTGSGLSEFIYTNFSLEELQSYRPNVSFKPLLEKPDNSNLNGIFSYVSKDDCTVASAPVKFNPHIIQETVLPVLDIIAAVWEVKKPLIGAVGSEKELYDVSFIPAPDPIVYSQLKGNYIKNWLCTYNDYAKLSYGVGWEKQADDLCFQKNKELKAKLVSSFGGSFLKEKPQISVVAKVE